MECPLCLNDFSLGDSIYPLKCPTSSCSFNYCADCIENLQKSASDGYQLASDGSYQVKVHVRCPQCRDKYQCKAYPSELIVRSVLLLRKAAVVEPLILNQCDSDLSATKLNEKHDFLKQTSLEELQDSVRRLHVYQKEIGKLDPHGVPQLKWEVWKLHVRETAPMPSSPRDSPTGRLALDPTLFQGLDELITIDEQQFLTALLTSGNPDSLAQAAHILSGILEMSASRAVEQLSTFSSPPSGPSPTNSPQLLQRIRKKYPLPSRMPRCVRLAVYDPSTTKLLKFNKTHDGLELANIKGPIGRLGLRKGDIVTHVNVENVSTNDDFYKALQRAQGDETLWLIVNADAETAINLRKRAQQMRNDKVQFAASS